jgi:hypothetical protein
MRILSVISLLVFFTACGTQGDKKSEQNVARVTPYQGDEAKLLQQTKAPQYLVTITDQNNKVVSARMVSEKPNPDNAVQEIEAVKANKPLGNTIKVLDADNDASQGSSDSFFSFSWTSRPYAYYGYSAAACCAAPAVAAYTTAYTYSYPTYSYGFYSYPYYQVAAPVTVGSYTYTSWYRGSSYYAAW